MKIKVCGMTNAENIISVARLQPDYMGFIFYEKSKRFFNGTMPKLPEGIKKTGVFVNEDLQVVIERVNQYKLGGCTAAWR